MRTLVAEVHLSLEGLEVVGDARLDLAAHLLPRPLLEAVELLVDEHGGWLRWSSAVAWCSVACWDAAAAVVVGVEARLRGVVVIRSRNIGAWCLLT